MKHRQKERAAIGEDLARLRKAAGFTQAEVAEFLGIDPTAVNKVENGTRDLGAGEALLVSQMLGVSVADLLMAESGQPMLRAESLDDPGVREALGIAERVTDDFFWTRAAFRRHSHKRAVFVTPQTDPSLAAADARARLGLGDGPLPEVMMLIDRLGVGVTAAPIESTSFAGMLLIRREIPFVLVNTKLAPVRQRFTLAHELGHWLLRHGEVADSRKLMYSKDPRERAANDFAAEFLVPVASVDRWYRMNQVSKTTLEIVAELANEFDVSCEMMIYRLEAAKKVGRDLKGKLVDAIRRGDHLPIVGTYPSSFDGVSVFHGGGNTWPILVPSEMWRTLIAAVRDGRIEIAEAAAKLQLQPEQLQGFFEYQDRRLHQESMMFDDDQVEPGVVTVG